MTATLQIAGIWRATLVVLVLVLLPGVAAATPMAAEEIPPEWPQAVDASRSSSVVAGMNFIERRAELRVEGYQGLRAMMRVRLPPERSRILRHLRYLRAERADPTRERVADYIRDQGLGIEASEALEHIRERAESEVLAERAAYERTAELILSARTGAPREEMERAASALLVMPELAEVRRRVAEEHSEPLGRGLAERLGASPDKAPLSRVIAAARSASGSYCTRLAERFFPDEKTMERDREPFRELCPGAMVHAITSAHGDAVPEALVLVGYRDFVSGAGDE